MPYVCVMYVKCCSLVRYRPYFLSGTLLFNRRSLPAAGNYYYYTHQSYLVSLIVCHFRFATILRNATPANGEGCMYSTFTTSTLTFWTYFTMNHIQKLLLNSISSQSRMIN